MPKTKKKKADRVKLNKKSDKKPTSEPTPQTGKLIDMEQAIQMLKTTRPTFYRWLRAGKVKGMKVGRQWRFYVEDIERFLKGEEPRVDLPADITPLLNALRTRLEELGEKYSLPDEPAADKVVEAVNLMIHITDKIRASDIHLAPHVREDSGEKIAVLRYRVNGILKVIAEIDIRLMPAIVGRWKSMANCDVLDKEHSQEGWIRTTFSDNRKIGMAVRFVPTGLGESLTGCITSGGALLFKRIDDLGFSSKDKKRIEKWLKAPSGIIVVGGPAGSGRTSVLYTFLKHIAKAEIKVLTVEDPVEYFLPWTVQIPVKKDAGETFASALRTAFNSDPDVIMVGELADNETLNNTQSIALTGHLVLTSMQAKCAVDVLYRMVEMGSYPQIIGESVKLIIVQRLVPKLCTNCSVEQKSPSKELLQSAMKIAHAGGLDWDSLPKKFRKRIGCEKCRHWGYYGRTIIAEVLEVTPEIIAALKRGASTEEMQNIAIEQGMTTMVADVVRKATMGVTSLTEVMRIVPGLT